MTNEIINKMIDAINFGIEGALYEFKNHGSSEFYNRCYSEICGMIRMLEIATGKRYYFDETGLHERIKIAPRPSAANGYSVLTKES